MSASGRGLDDSCITQPMPSSFKTSQIMENSPEVLMTGTNPSDSMKGFQDIPFSVDNQSLHKGPSQRYFQAQGTVDNQSGENLTLADNSWGEQQQQQHQVKQSVGVEGSSNKYVCHWCGRNFDRISNLKRHVLLHSGIKPFKCLYCNYRATQKANVVQHLASIHRDEMRSLLHNNINVNDILVPSAPING